MFEKTRNISKESVILQDEPITIHQHWVLICLKQLKMNLFEAFIQTNLIFFLYLIWLEHKLFNLIVKKEKFVFIKTKQI